MKLLYIVAFTTIFNFSSFASDCPFKCKVSRVIEEGVFLGVQINGISPCQKNCMIQQIVPNTAAEKSGLKQGDIILKIDNQEINAENQLVDVIARYKAGDKIVVSYVNGENIKKMKIRLGAKTTRIVEEMECCDEIKETVSINSESDITVYPNPAKTSINIATKQALEGDVHLMIYSHEGKEMYYDVKTMDESLNLTIDVSKYNSGNYFVRIETAKTNLIQKFEIVQ